MGVSRHTLQDLIIYANYVSGAELRCNDAPYEYVTFTITTEQHESGLIEIPCPRCGERVQVPLRESAVPDDWERRGFA